MRSKQGIVAVATCFAMAVGGLTAEAAPAKTKASSHHAKPKKHAKKKHARRCKILLVNGVHRCKGEHSRTSASSTRPVINITINNVQPAHTDAATPTTPATPTRQTVLQQILAAIPGASKHDADRLRDAANKLTESLSSDKPLDKEKDAVRKLLELQRDGTALPVHDWINTLVGDARSLASAGNAGELAKGDAERTAGRADSAIDHYKKAMH